MDTQKQRRISDIRFTMDSTLRVKDCNRSFMQFFNTTETSLNLADVLSKADAEGFKLFLKKIDDESIYYNYLCTIKNNEIYSPSIFIIKKEDKLFTCEIQELSYTKEVFENTLLENRQLRLILSNFNSDYFIYRDGKFSLYNTKDMNLIYEAELKHFKKYFIENFQIDLTKQCVETQLDTLLADVQNYTDERNFKLPVVNKKAVTIKIRKASSRETTVMIGIIAKKNVVLDTSNAYEAQKDGLTGLYNKVTVTELAKKKIEESKQNVSLFIIDIDKFKDFNDTFGHSFGDKVLVTVSNILKLSVNGLGVAGRIGGDEFLCVVDRTEEEDLREISRNIRLGIQWSIPAINPDCVVTCSIGIARSPMNAKSYDDLFHLADKCLYIAKNKGRNCYVIYKPEIHDKVIVKNETKAQDISSGKYFTECAQCEEEILKSLENKTPEGFKKTMRLLISYLDVSKITIYDGKLKLKFIAGSDPKDFRSIYFSDTYFQYFNEYDYLLLDNTNALDTIDKTKYDMYLAESIGSTFEILCKGKTGKPQGLICLDIYKPARTFDKSKIIFSLMIAKKLVKNINSEK